MMKYTVEYNYCDCHPETCCCDRFILKENGKYYLTDNDKQKLVNLAEKLNTLDSQNENKKG